jgi:hypothetical protein
MRGRVTAMMWVVLAGVQPLGALLGGWLGTMIGVRAALWILFGVVTVSGTALLSRGFVRERDLPAARAEGDRAGAAA